MRVMDASELDLVVASEMRLLQSDVRGDRAELERLLDEEFVEIGASGRVWTRVEIVADLVASPALNVEPVGVSARHIDASIVLVMYTNISNERRVLRSSWWRNVNGAWKCFFHQGTVVP